MKFAGIPCPSPFKGKAPGNPRGFTMSQKQLNALRKGAVPAGAVLNPYGQCGNTQRARYRATYFGYTHKPAYREAAMRRKRIKLKLKKAIALEAHELQQLAREHATMALQTLVTISKSKRAPESTRIAASSVILDRAYGKASQTTITASVTSGKTKDLTGADLNKRIDHALKRVEAATTRVPKARTSQKRPADLRKLN